MPVHGLTRTEPQEQPNRRFERLAYYGSLLIGAAVVAASVGGIYLAATAGLYVMVP